MKQRLGQVISTQLMAGMPVGHVYSDAPLPGYELLEPDLEDVHFHQINLASSLQAA